MVTTQPGTQNIFNITDPERYRCQMLHYHARLSRLYLSVYKDAQTAPLFYLLFADVAYVQCPTGWQGASFDIASEDACIALLLETGLIGAAIARFPGAYAALTDAMRLYTVQTRSQSIRLIAGSASMLHVLPAALG